MSQVPATEAKPLSDKDFLSELKDCWGALPNKPFFFILLAAWLALFQFYGNGTFGYIDTASLMGWMMNAYSNKGSDGQDSHGMYVPFAVLLLLWIKRRELLAVRFQLWWPGLLIMAGGLILHVAGYLTQQPRVSIIGFFLGIYGLTGLSWGPGWLKASFFPYFLFCYCVPISSISQGVTVPLRMMVTKATYVIAHDVMGLHILRDGAILSNATRTYAYEVAAACSGIQSLIAIVALNTVIAFLILEGFWRRTFIIASAVPLALVSNIFRLLLIITAAEWYGHKAGDFVHENFFFSLLPYVPSIGGAILLTRWLEKKPAPEPVKVETSTAEAYTNPK